MKTYKVTQERLNELKKIVNTDLAKIQEIYQDEFNICSNRLDHIDIKSTQITFIDRGHDFGDGVIDSTYRIISK
jgi:hypothetical protein